MKPRNALTPTLILVLVILLIMTHWNGLCLSLGPPECRIILVMSVLLVKSLPPLPCSPYHSRDNPVLNKCKQIYSVLIPPPPKKKKKKKNKSWGWITQLEDTVLKSQTRYWWEFNSHVQQGIFVSELTQCRLAYSVGPPPPPPPPPPPDTPLTPGIQ